MLLPVESGDSESHSPDESHGHGQPEGGRVQSDREYYVPEKKLQPTIGIWRRTKVVVLFKTIRYWVGR